MVFFSTQIVWPTIELNIENTFYRLEKLLKTQLTVLKIQAENPFHIVYQEHKE